MSFRVERLLRTLVRDIAARRAAESGEQPGEPLVALLVKSTVLDPVNNFNPDKELSDDELARIVDLVLGRLRAEQDISLLNIRAQLYFEANHLSLDDVVSKRKAEMNETMQDFEDEIIDMRPQTRDDLEALYRKIVASVALRTGLGDASDPAVINETAGAVQSVLPPEDLSRFLNLTRGDKRRELRDLALIVAGIRIFNWNQGRGGTGVDDLRSMIKSETAALCDSCLQHYERIHPHLVALVGALQEDQTDPQSRTDVRNDEVAVAANLTQMVRLIQVLLSDALESSTRYAGLNSQVVRLFSELNQAVNPSQAVPTERVFPLFVELGQTWDKLFCERAFVRRVSSLHRAIVTFTDAVLGGRSAPADGAVLAAESQHAFQVQRASVQKVRFETLRQLDALAESDEEPAQIEGLEPVDPVILAFDADADLHVLLPGNTHGFSQLQLQLGGFCPVSVATSGAFVPANRDVGVIKQGNKMFGFASVDALRAFVQDPTNVMTTLVRLARRRAELISLLELQQAFSRLVGGADVAVKVKCDAGAQTELHPIESNIDKSYHWNEWELRRQAIKLANLRQKKTHSTQTHLSHFRRDNTTQIYPLRPKSSQTRRNAQTNTSKPVTYIKGLRGHTGEKAEPVQTVDLTLGVGGKPLPALTRVPPKMSSKATSRSSSAASSSRR